MTRLSCIIPAYNEGIRIANVLQAVVGHPLIGEIIVVNDCSGDDTCARVREYSNVLLLSNKKNQGKSNAIALGVLASTGDYLLFLDADLVGLTAADVTELIQPVLCGSAELSISLRSDALLPWRIIGLDYLSGERVLSRALVEPHMAEIAHLPSFGLELYMNQLHLDNGGRLSVARWKHVSHTYKIRKYGVLRGILGEARMLMNILETIALIGTGSQIAAMLRSRVASGGGPNEVDATGHTWRLPGSIIGHSLSAAYQGMTMRGTDTAMVVFPRIMITVAGLMFLGILILAGIRLFPNNQDFGGGLGAIVGCSINAVLQFGLYRRGPL
jgi:glycosyltransferase involved in cell wall biosynthesis